MDLTKIKLPTAFLIAVFIFIGLQIGVAAISKTLTVREGYDALFDPTDRLPGIEETVIAWQLKNIRDDHNRADIILLGDSSCLVGLDPIRMEHALGVKVLNMGTIGWLMSEGHVDLLEAFIKRHGPPQLVVYHLSEELMQLEQHDIDASGFLYRLRVALGKEIGKDDFFNMLPMYKYRNELKKYRSLRKNENDYRHMPRGAWPSATDMLIELSRTKGHITDPTPGTYQYKPGHSFKNNENIFPGLMRLADLGQQYGFKIYFIYSPLPDSILKSEPEEFKKLEMLIRTHIGQRNEFILREPIFTSLGNEYFQTQYSHVNAAGAKANTEQLIRDIKTLHLLKK